MSDADVLVVGAGVGGAALALALARAGVKVQLIDRRPGPGNTNRGDSLLPSVTRQLAAWGALPALMAAGARPVSRLEVYEAGVQLLAAPLDGASPYLILPHAEIERVLVAAAAAAGARVHYRHAFLQIRSVDGRVCGATVRSPCGGETEVQARVVVGADGGRSSVRGALGVALHARPYRHAYFVVDVDRPAGYRDALRLDLHGDGGVMTVPQPGGRVGLGVLVQPHDRALFRAAPLADKLRQLGRRSPLFTGLRAHAGSHLYPLARGHADRYVAPGAALLGDAAHLTNPTAGQGMTLAVEDAAALARLLIPALAAPRVETVDAALAAYQRERRPRNRAQVRWSHWLSRIYSLRGPLGDVARRELARLAGSPLGRTAQQLVWRQIADRRCA